MPVKSAQTAHEKGRQEEESAERVEPQRERPARNRPRCRELNRVLPAGQEPDERE